MQNFINTLNVYYSILLLLIYAYIRIHYRVDLRFVFSYFFKSLNSTFDK